MTFPEPSVSTPLQSSQSEARTEINQRPRRHTITRPDSAMALLSDLEDDEDDEEQQQQTFDRISNILSSLIQEANDAVHGIEHERVQLLSSQKKTTPRVFTSSTILTKHPQRQQQPQQPHTQQLHQQQQQQQQQQQHHHHTALITESKIPRPSRRSCTPTHQRNISASSSSSSSTHSLFSPGSVASSSTTATTHSRSPSPTFTNFKKQLFRHTAMRPRSCPTMPPRRSMTPKKKNVTAITVSDPIMESFKRLDSSMALVDSLSRDLAATQKTKETNKMIFLLLVPLLHIPHSLITVLFEFCSSGMIGGVSGNSGGRSAAFSFSSMIFWACVFAATSLMVDQVSVTPAKRYWTQKVRRLSLPGAYTDEGENDNKSEEKKKNKNKSSSRKGGRAEKPAVVVTTTTTTKTTTTTTTAVPIKRTWIPATVQQQYQFRLGEQIPPPQVRRNSI